ncbi:CARDB domain-containing protein [Streptomyces sp. NPDC127092]|uniref:CARDB domain-containing protein n=1 Tax=Streptomyces sp. NPDC127092 TaxID=3347135 RepID=UPI003664647E
MQQPSRDTGWMVPFRSEKYGTQVNGRFASESGGRGGTAYLSVPFSRADLGRTITVTITIDPDNAIRETNENNNVGRYSVTLPKSAETAERVQCQPV